jgi:hypothetical protein
MSPGVVAFRDSASDAGSPTLLISVETFRRLRELVGLEQAQL